MPHLIRSFAADRRGTVAILVAFGLVPVSLTMGIALDYSRALSERTNISAALDSALIAAAIEKDPAKREAVARQVYAVNAKSDNRLGTDQLTFWPSNDGQFYHGKVVANVQTTLMNLTGHRSLGITTEQAVNLDNNPVCLYVLKPTGTSLTMNSSAEIKMPGCEVHVKSTSSNAVQLNSQSKVNAEELCVAGEIEYKSALPQSNYSTHCKPIEKLPVVKPVEGTSSCDYTNQKYSASKSILPGTICNGMEMKNGTLTLQPGFYRVRNGPISLMSSATLIAEGVTLYFEDEKSFIENKSNATVRITAPTFGDYRGVAMFEKPGLPFSNVEMNSSTNALYQGLFYLPSRNITMNSSSSITSKKMTLVAYTATFNSSSEWAVDPVPEEDLRLYDTRIALMK